MMVYCTVGLAAMFAINKIFFSHKSPACNNAHKMIHRSLSLLQRLLLSAWIQIRTDRTLLVATKFVVANSLDPDQELQANSVIEH